MLKKLLTKYKNTEFENIDDLYKDIIFDTHKKNFITLYKKSTLDLNYINLESYLEHNNKHFKNYNIEIMGNMGGLSISITKKGGGKLYINSSYYQIKPLQKDAFISICKQLDFSNSSLYRSKIIINNTNYTFKATNSQWELSRNFKNYEKKYDLIIEDIDKKILILHFIIDFLHQIDETNFVDTLAFKFFNFIDYRSDQLNIYTSNKIKNSDELSLKLINLLKALINKYEKLGLHFDRDSFMLPYELDSDKIIANSYIPESFNKSIIYFIMLYNTKRLDLCAEFFYYNELKEYNNNKSINIEKIKNYMQNKLDKNISFEEFVLNIFDLIESDSNLLDDYIRTYRAIFRDEENKI